MTVRRWLIAATKVAGLTSDQPSRLGFALLTQPTCTRFDTN